MKLPKRVKQLIKSKKFSETIIEEYQKYRQEQMDSFFFGDYAHLAKPIEPPHPKAQNNNIKH